MKSWMQIIAYLNSDAHEAVQKDCLVIALKEVSDALDAFWQYLAQDIMDTKDQVKCTHQSKNDNDSESLGISIKKALLEVILEPRSGICEERILMLGILAACPVACRAWFLNLDNRKMKHKVDGYVRNQLSPLIINRTLSVIESGEHYSSSDKFKVYSSWSRRGIVASLEVEDGHCIELSVSFPSNFPLKCPEVKIEKLVGVSEAKARKWMLSITAFLLNNNGSITEVIKLWKKNVDKEFEGHEDCLICYSIIQPSTGQLPRLVCKTCHQKFHGTCLYKWFKSSLKSNCPHCQSPW